MNTSRHDINHTHHTNTHLPAWKLWVLGFASSFVMQIPSSTGVRTIEEQFLDAFQRTLSHTQNPLPTEKPTIPLLLEKNNPWQDLIEYIEDTTKYTEISWMKFYGTRHPFYYISVDSNFTITYFISQSGNLLQDAKDPKKIIRQEKKP